MGMRQQHRIDRSWIERQARSISILEFLPALEEAAVNQKPAALGLQECFGSGDSLRCTEEAQLHALPSC
jgi:hypothetical protein